MNAAKPLPIAPIIISILALLSLGSIFFFNGVGLEADSIHHHLIAKFSLNHPKLLLDHWGKPLYTILSMPFAQFGFKGTQIFNWFCQLFILFFLWKSAQKLNLKHAYLAPLFYFLFPITITTGYFGFTEPLCAVFLIVAFYCLLKKKFLIASLLISLTPFIRSEGLIFIGLFGLFFLYKRDYKSLLGLGFGHLVFIFVGYIFNGEDLLWVFNKIPYASLNSHYGSGKLFHFADKLIYLLGIPSLILFIIAIIGLPFNHDKSKREFLLFSFAIFFVFFLAHSLFWYLGIFNSMGLERVFGAISPFMAILVLAGLNSFITLLKNEFLKKSVLTIITIYTLIFPFTSNPAAVDWNKELNLSPPQLMANKTSEYINENNLKGRRFIYTDVYLSVPLAIDPFNKKERLILSEAALKNLKKGDIIIWDNWHSIVDYGVSFERLIKEERLQKLTSLEDHTHKSLVQYVVFEVSV